jgi:hypothetical protein
MRVVGSPQNSPKLFNGYLHGSWNSTCVFGAVPRGRHWSSEYDDMLLSADALFTTPYRRNTFKLAIYRSAGEDETLNYPQTFPISSSLEDGGFCAFK